LCHIFEVMINDLAQNIHKTAKDKGFYNSERNMGEMLALIHSEVSEALEADRKNGYATGNVRDVLGLDLELFKEHFEAELKNTFEDELADIVIRVMDLAAYKSIDLEGHIQAKIRYNTTREHKHGKKY